ncbi:MAG: DUF255 domain-containing protein, partial [Hyphomicrobiaceae bacterium]
MTLARGLSLTAWQTLVFLVLICAIPFAAIAEEKRTKPNRLANEASPYLRQHANNPVDWYPWGKEAFEKARKENKPILLSVGYSTCHWCHVMERESYSDKDIADVLNTHFVAIKVDRERRPEVDETYMIATEMLNQAGGWPNNVFLTPELKPFAAITYLPKPQFKQMMQEINQHWRNNPGPIMGQAERVANVIAAYMQSRVDARTVTPQLLKSLVKQATQHFDDFNGGIGVAPKFPQESLLLFLLEQAERNLNPRAREVALTTLDNIITGGIRDHVGGGFHRYAVDPRWRVPHFEKMLYTQALLGQALIQAYRMTGRERYARAARQTMDHVIRDMQRPSGAFATAFDAESKTADGKKKEGAFFVWTPDQIGKALSAPDAELASKVFGITKEGNFHGKSIPHLAHPHATIAKETGTPLAKHHTRMDAIRSRLNDIRSKRPPPLRDDKILTGWNALMIRTMANAAVILKAPRYSIAAARAAEHLWQAHFNEPGELRRFAFEGKTSLLATQPDHAFLAVAFIALYDATGEAKWLERAEQLTKRMHALFFDKEAGDYIMAKSDGTIPDAKIRTDQPVPSGNAVALELYAKLARRTMSNEYRQRAHNVLAAVSGVAAGSPASSGYVLKSADELLRGELGTVQFLALGRVRIALTRLDNDRAKLDIEIAPGWHINAHKPLEDHFIPTVVSLQGPGKPKPANVGYPEALERKLGFAENKMALYEGKLTIPVTLPERDKPVRAIVFA